MNFIQWNNLYITDIELVDEHHQKLFSLVNSLYRGVFECQDLTEERCLTKSILAELKDYIDYHFTAEEQLMSKYNYPEYIQHLEEHNLFRREIASLSEQLDAGKFALSFPMFEFLRNWLTNHILISDKKYSPWVIECGVK